MQKTKIIQKDYSLSSMNYQLKLPFELEVLIPDITIANPEKESRASCTATKLPSSVQLCHPPEAFIEVGVFSDEINKLHNKIQNDKTGHHLFELKKTA